MMSWEYDVSKLIKLCILSSFMISCIPSTCFLILNSSKLSILVAQTFLYWQFLFSFCSFTCSMTLNPWARSCVQSGWLLQFVWQKHFKMSIVIYVNVLHVGPLWFLLSVMSGAAFSQTTHGSLAIISTRSEQGRPAALRCDSRANAVISEVGNKEYKDIHLRKTQ